MNRTGMAIVVGTVFCMSAAAQSQTGAQAGAQTSGQTSLEASQTPAQASGSGHGRGVGPERPGKRFIGEWHGLQCRTQFANRLKEVQAG